MLKEINIQQNKLLYACYAILLLSILFYLLTKSLLILFSPAIFLYMVLCITNYKAAYMLLLLGIPLSIRFSLAENQLSLSLPDEPMCWLLFIVFILIVAYNYKIVPAWFINNPIMFIIFLQYIWLILAVIFSTVFYLSVKFFIAKTWYLVCFLFFPVLLFNTKKDFINVFLLIVVPCLVTVFVIIFRHSSQHFSFDSIKYAVGNLYINHVEYSAVISMLYPIMWVAYPLIPSNQKRLKNIFLTLIILFLPIIYFTYARAAIVAIVFAGLVGMAIKFRLVNYILPIIYCCIIITLMYFTYNKKYIDLHPDYTHTVMHNDYKSHLTSTFKGRDVSSMERLYRWVAAIRMSSDKPLFGYGPHGFVHNYKKYTLTIFKTYSSNNIEKSTTHNYFLYMLTEQGIPAMLLYALLYVYVFAMAQNTYFRFHDVFYKYCTLGLIMAFAAAFVNNFFSELIETHKVGALFYLIISILLILNQKSKESATNNLNLMS